MTSPDSSPEFLPLEVQTGERLRARGLTLAVAESSTGGLIAKCLTDISGSSAYVIGGVIASTLLTLVVVPVLYSLLDDLTGRRGGKSAGVDLNHTVEPAAIDSPLVESRGSAPPLSSR